RAKELRDNVLSYAENTSDRFRFHDAGTLLGVLGNLLAGEILLSEGDSAGALSAFRTAVSLEDSLGYDEPEPLPFAARHWLGAALLESGAYAEAELAYRTELANHPHNGWSLFGLQKALSAQGKTDPKVDLDLAASWARSTVELKSSRF
ncbi:tetratricopeptide repeat protein, partial [Congregibacter sp.]|uniref:tetratricopeptide repeat protein n=1 Tax=Congregibacter sp. TaxID=2744308 RepID=UPI00385CFC9B